MIKACCECIFGSPTNGADDNDHGYVPLSHIKKTLPAAWPVLQSPNKNTFLVPKSLDKEDTIIIIGFTTSNPQNLSINFITSEDGNIDFQNIACQLDVNFTENKVLLRTIKNGIPQISPDESYKDIPATELLTGLKFSFGFAYTNVDDGFIDIYYDIDKNFASKSFLGQIALQHHFSSIKYLEINGDVQHVETLKWIYRSPVSMITNGSYGEPSKMLFLIPRKLNDQDKISISGVLTTEFDPKSLNISLVTGNDQVDYENIACQLKANFDENTLETVIVTDGKSEVTGDENSATDLITTGSSSAFNVSFTYIVNSQFDFGLLDIYSNNAYLNQIALSHSIDDIRYVAIDGDVKYMESFELHMSPS